MSNRRKRSSEVRPINCQMSRSMGLKLRVRVLASHVRRPEFNNSKYPNTKSSSFLHRVLND